MSCAGSAVAKLLDSGEVNTTTLAMVAKYMKRENASEMITAIKGKSKRAVERYVAGLEPMATLPPDRVRAIVVPQVTMAAPQQTASLELTVAGDGKKSSSVEKSTPNLTPAEAPQFTHMARVEFTAHEELIEKLDRIRSLVSHRLRGNASLEELITFMADYLIERKDPVRRYERREARAARQERHMTASVPDNPRQIPRAVRDQVFARDQRCTYVGADGEQCNSTHVLQVDHIQPVARRGAAVIENLRLLCAYHNRMESERLMGKRHVLREPRVRYVVV